jgi:hypothetical protein
MYRAFPTTRNVCQKQCLTGKDIVRMLCTNVNVGDRVGSMPKTRIVGYHVMCPTVHVETIMAVCPKPGLAGTGIVRALCTNVHVGYVHVGYQVGSQCAKNPD